MKPCVAAALTLAMLAASALAADEAPVTPQDAAARVAVDRAVACGLDYLAQQQQADGSFTLAEGGQPAVAAALLAFVASGNTPGLGRHGWTVHNAADFLAKSPVASQRADQAMVVLALSQVCGVENDAALHARVRRALDEAVAALLKFPAAPADSDAKIWSELALRCAHAAGAATGNGGSNPPPLPAASPAATQNASANPAQQLLSSLLLYRGGPEAWPAMGKRSRGLWLARQNPDGTFSAASANGEPPGRVWPTAMAALDLALGDHYLPLDRGK